MRNSLLDFFALCGLPVRKHTQSDEYSMNGEFDDIEVPARVKKIVVPRARFKVVASVSKAESEQSTNVTNISSLTNSKRESVRDCTEEIPILLIMNKTEQRYIAASEANIRNIGPNAFIKVREVRVSINLSLENYLSSVWNSSSEIPSDKIKKRAVGQIVVGGQN